MQRLGQRHAGYGVQAHHYATVGDALLGTLAELFGPAFNDEVRQAWTSAMRAAGDHHAGSRRRA